MSHANEEEALIARLVECDEAVYRDANAVGGLLNTESASGSATAVFQRAQKCLALLASLWHKRASDGSPKARLNSPKWDGGVPCSSLPAASRLECGRDFGRFRILEVLGEGGMGTVYKAWHTRLHRVVALKVLAARWTADTAILARFRREMEIASALDHRHLIRAFDADELNGIHFLVMEYIEGADLATLVGRLGPLTVPDACEIVHQAALGIEEVHRLGLVHRDIKPSNLVLGRDGRVRLLDFGLALLNTPDREVLTNPGQTLGTADYMAPEQLLDPCSVDGRSDIYSLGCTLYFLLCGQAPFGGEGFDTAGKKLLAHATLPPPPLDARRKDISTELQAAVARMLAKEPLGRLADSSQVIEAVKPLAVGANLLDLICGLSDNTLSPSVGQ